MLKFVSILNLLGTKNTYSINVRVWVLGLSMLSQDTRGNLVDLGD